MRFQFIIPIRAAFTLNSRSHWAIRSKVRKRERNATALAFRMSRPTIELSPPYRIYLTRFGPRKLDSDNVQGALKAIRDQIAAELGINDGSPLITWVYGQATGPYAVHVAIESTHATPSPTSPAAGPAQPPTS